MLATAITIPVTNAAKQENRTKFSIKCNIAHNPQRHQIKRMGGRGVCSKLLSAQVFLWSKLLSKDSGYRSGCSPDWLKMKNADAPAVKRDLGWWRRRQKICVAGHRRASERQCLRSAICATRSKGPAVPIRVGHFGPGLAMDTNCSD